MVLVTVLKAVASLSLFGNIIIMIWMEDVGWEEERMCYVPLTLEVSLFRLRSPFSHIVIIICGLVSSLLLLLLLLVAVAGEKGERETTETLRVK